MPKTERVTGSQGLSGYNIKEEYSFECKCGNWITEESIYFPYTCEVCLRIWKVHLNVVATCKEE